MKKSFFKSIRTQLLLLVLISLFPALGIIIYSGLYWQHQETREAEKDALRMVQSLGREYEQAVESTRQFLMTLAKLPEIQNVNIPASNKLLGELLKQNPLYGNIFIVDAEGTFCSSAVPFTPQSLKHRKYFQEVLKSKDFSTGEYVVGAAVKRPVFHFAYPILDDSGKFKGVVGVALNLAHYGMVFSAAKLPNGSILAITDHKGIRLYSHLYPEKYVGNPDRRDHFEAMTGRWDEGTFRGRGSDGTRRLYAFKRFHLPKQEAPYLFMRIGISEEEAFSLARRDLFINMGLMFFAFVVAMASAWFVGKIILVERLNKLVDASEQLGSGDLTARTGLAHSQDELGQVTEAFDNMAAQLEQKDSQRKAAEEALRLSEERYRSIFENSVEGITQTTPEGQFISVNPAMARIYGYDSPEDMIAGVTDIGKQLYVDPEERATYKSLLDKYGEVNRFELQCYKKDGTVIWVSLNSHAAKDADGKLIRYESTVEDITDRKQLAEDLQKMAIVDDLTGLYNRRGFLTLAQQQFKLSERESRGMVMFFMDIDRMKWINDTLGHKEGDRALIEAAAVLRQTFRESDIIGRIGGDEFAILAIDGTEGTRETLSIRLQNILENYNKTYAGKYLLSLSVGAVRYDPEIPISLDDLISRADALMYEEKKKKQ